MPFLQALAIFAAGLAAGTINTVVGSGTLITFPTLLAFGYPPVLANVSNNVGLVPGVASGVHGYRAELEGQRRRIIRLGSASACGGLVGAILLLVLPAEAFKAIVPALIGVAVVMVLIQPRLARWMARRQLARSAGRAGDGDLAAQADGADPGSRPPADADHGTGGAGGPRDRRDRRGRRERGGLPVRGRRPRSACCPPPAFPAGPTRSADRCCGPSCSAPASTAVTSARRRACC